MFHGWKDNSMLAKPLAACTYLLHNLLLTQNDYEQEIEEKFHPAAVNISWC